MKLYHYLSVLFCALLFAACSYGSSDMDKPIDPEEGENDLTFDMTGVSTRSIENAQVYQFDGDGAEIGQFRTKIVNITRTANELKMPISVGKWDLVLISGDGVENVTPPVRGSARSALKMYENKPVGGFLPSMPEFRSARIKGQLIQANTSHQADAILARNVAMVKVVIDDASGFDVAGDHKIYLLDVPTTLNWDGGLYPDKDNPDVSTSPMKGEVTISNDPGGRQKSNEAVFIVPAHHGANYPIDESEVTTHTLKLGVDLKLSNGNRFERTDVEIPIVPKANKILLVKCSVTGILDIETEILDWEDKEVDVNVGLTNVYVSKASMGMSYKDTLFVKSSSDFTVTPGDSWVSATKTTINAQPAVIVTSDVNTYPGTPRSSFITVKSNNVTKKIPVEQRPDVGTISTSPSKIILSPGNVGPSKSVTVNSTRPWIFVGTSEKATVSPLSGTAGSSTTFTRKTTNSIVDRSCYGNEIVKFKNNETLETVDVEVCNLFLDAPPDITLNNFPGTNYLEEAITAYGGQGKYVVTNHSPWITIESVGQDKLQISAPQTDDTEARDPDGFIEIAHVDDLSYKATIVVKQDIYIAIDPFQFFVVKFTWFNGSDVDVAGAFLNSDPMDNGSPVYFDDKAVGWQLGIDAADAGDSYTNKVVYFDATNTTRILQWGGDAQSGQGETIFFNAPYLEGDNGLPRKLFLEIYATWYSGSWKMPTDKRMTLWYGAYGNDSWKDPNVSPPTWANDKTNFTFSGGNWVYEQDTMVYVEALNGGTSGSGKPAGYPGGASQAAQYKTYYDHIATITYDRIKRSASLKVHAQGVTTRAMRAARAQEAYINEEAEGVEYDSTGKIIVR